MSTVLGVTALTVLRRVERKDDHALRRKISLVLDGTAPPLASMIAALTNAGVVIAPAQYEKHFDEQRVDVAFHATFPASASECLLELIESQPGVRHVRVESVT